MATSCSCGLINEPTASHCDCGRPLIDGLTPRNTKAKRAVPWWRYPVGGMLIAGTWRAVTMGSGGDLSGAEYVIAIAIIGVVAVLVWRFLWR